MAKAKNKQAAAVVVAPEVTVKESPVEPQDQPTSEAQAVVLTEATVVVAPVAHKVTVVPLSSFKARIGLESYEFIKEIPQKVPAFVESFLRERKKIR